MLPFLSMLQDQQSRELIQEYAESHQIAGIALLMLMQILQVIIAFIPGEAIEVLAGILYGTFYGLIICMTGMVIGTISIFYTMRLIGDKWLKNSVKLDKYRFLQDSKKLELLIFILFFIPGTPKDLLTYFVPFTEIKPTTFFLIVAIARIPSILSSTYAGAKLIEGEVMQSAVVFIIIGAVGIIGILIHNKFLNKMNNSDKKIDKI